MLRIIFAHSWKNTGLHGLLFTVPFSHSFPKICKIGNVSPMNPKYVLYMTSKNKPVIIHKKIPPGVSKCMHEEKKKRPGKNRIIPQELNLEFIRVSRHIVKILTSNKSMNFLYLLFI